MMFLRIAPKLPMQPYLRRRSSKTGKIISETTLFIMHSTQISRFDQMMMRTNQQNKNKMSEREKPHTMKVGNICQGKNYSESSIQHTAYYMCVPTTLTNPIFFLGKIQIYLGKWKVRMMIKKLKRKKRQK